MSKPFSTVPQGALKVPQPFTLHVPEQELTAFRTLLELSPIAPETYYNRQEDGQFGVSRKWLIDAKDAWLKYDWRALEGRINAIPNFKAEVDRPNGGTAQIHFAALFSHNPEAVPLISMHGWPGTFLESLPVLELLKDKYTPDTLPYHVIIPSLPGYGLSADALPLDTETTMITASGILHQLMLDLGFSGGYAAFGGDVGSLLARRMSQYPECKAIHLSTLASIVDREVPPEEYYTSAGDIAHRERSKKWAATGAGYFGEHGTRPATIGLALSSSPLALLAWIGEKYIEWVDPQHPLSIDQILQAVSLYWFTAAYPQSLYPYRELFTLQRTGSFDDYQISPDVRLGYSYAPREISFAPRKWAEDHYPNLAFYSAHDKGGHFFALEQPQMFLKDMEDFIHATFAT